VTGIPQVLIRIDGVAGRITLNRPEVLHALTRDMSQEITAALQAWRRDPAVQVILIDHSGPRGFCAGGDIRMLADSGYGDGAAARQFFRDEYQLNHLMFGYPKPLISFMDGIVMGGGAGLALPCRYRVATERTVFAMPETGIGLFTDVGGGWYLSRLPQRAGYWLGLTGARIKAADCLLLGLASHYASSSVLEAFKARICVGARPLDALFADLVEEPGSAPIGQHLPEIENAFSRSSVEDVIAVLSNGSPWAQEQAAILSTKSPQSMKVSWRLIEQGAGRVDFADEMRVEFRVASRVVQAHDFLQGVRAVILVKDGDPRWYPPTLSDMTLSAVDRIFSPLQPEDEWEPLNGAENA